MGEANAMSEPERSALVQTRVSKANVYSGAKMPCLGADSHEQSERGVEAKMC